MRKRAIGLALVALTSMTSVLHADVLFYCKSPHSINGILASVAWNENPDAIASCISNAGQVTEIYTSPEAGFYGRDSDFISEGPFYFLADEIRVHDGEIFLGTMLGKQPDCASPHRVYIPAEGKRCVFRPRAAS